MRRNGSTVLLIRAAIVLACSMPAALAWQAPLSVTKIKSPEPSGFGYEFARSTCVADIDGDGFDDIVVMEPGRPVQGLLWAGRGWILKGPTLQVMATFQASTPVTKEFLGAGGCRTGDVNGDGFIDILVGSPDFGGPAMPSAGRAHVFLGPDYTTDIVLQEPSPQENARFGSLGLLLTDMTGDGLDDVLITAPGKDVEVSPGVVLVDAGQLYFWDALDLFEPGGLRTPELVVDPQPVQNGFFGAVLLDADLNGDPQRDLLAVSNLTACCPLTTGQVYLFDGLGPVVLDTAGLAVVPSAKGVGSDIDLADVTGDGIPDLVLGAPSSTFPACQNAGLVVVLEGPSFDDVAFTLQSPLACQGSNWLFGARNLVADIDRDGSQDILAIDPGFFSGMSLAHLFWGPDYDTPETIGDEFAPANLVGFGVDMACGDFDGDGFDELAISATAGNASGSLYIYDVQTLTADTTTVSVAAGGSVGFALRMAPEEAGKTYLAALSVSGTSPGLILGPGSYLPLNPDGVTQAGLALLGSPLLVGFLGSLDGTASASFSLHLPPGFPQALVGATLSVAAVAIEPDGRTGAGSSAVDIALTP